MSGPKTRTEPPVCKCHGEPTRWSKNQNRPAGGNWRCTVKLRAASHRYDRTRREAQNAWVRAKYDRDPLWRLPLLMKNSRIKRLQTIARRREAHGTVPLEG